MLDCDPGHDDAIALLLALASPELELLGVTTTYGNQTLAKTTANALRVLELVERTDVPVPAGAARPLERELVVAAHVHGESGLDGPSLPEATTAPTTDDAVAFMVGRIAASSQPVSIVATGPLTNVARYLQGHGRAGIERIVLMGGAIAEGNFTPAAEFNVWCDPEAAAIVFESGLDVTMIGLDVTHQALLGPAIEARLRASGRVGAFVADLNVFFTRYHHETYGWDGAPIHDAAPWPTSSGPDSWRHAIATSPSSSSRSSAAGAPSSTSGGGPTGHRTRTSAWDSTRTRSSTCWSSGSPRLVKAVGAACTTAPTSS
jgi:pyrimidine-specific ribonucleoside hydrolase